MKVLVIGGYGNFGARICRALSADPLIELVIGGRDVQQAKRLADVLGSGATGVGIDVTSRDLADVLRRLGAQLVIHTAGPFQAQDYQVALAATASGAHYIDLADGRRFVCDFPAAVSAVFIAAGRTAVTGASTVPALSSAVVAHLSNGWKVIESIDMCIAPAQSAPRGTATMRAVLSYCGEPISVWSAGRWQNKPGWANLRAVQFARLRPRLGALCDIPDLELFPARFEVTQDVMFRAALEVQFAQRAFAALAALRSARLIGGLAPLAGVLNRLSPALDFLGTALGGMVVRVADIDADGAPRRIAWHIAADNDNGPEIPCMAAILLARKLASEVVLTPGASACMGLLALADFKPEFARWGMLTDTVCEA